MSIQRHHPTTAPVARPLTYAETQNAQPFDWWEFLDLADAGKIVLEGEEHLVATALALDWTTCATGNQCSVIPRSSVGSPLDGLLNDLGTSFYSYVKRARWSIARRCLRAIEARSAQLIAELSQP